MTNKAIPLVEESCADLAVAIVQTAVEDFKQTYKKILLNKELSMPSRSCPSKMNEAREFNNSLRFFASDWAVSLFPNLDMKDVYVRIKEKMENKYGDEYALKDFEFLDEEKYRCKN